jgi:hypothetical protein
MKWTDAIEWCKDHNAQLYFQQIGQLDVTVFWAGYYWSADGDYLQLPAIVQKLDTSIRQNDPLDGVFKTDFART